MPLNPFPDDPRVGAAGGVQVPQQLGVPGARGGGGGIAQAAAIRAQQGLAKKREKAMSDAIMANAISDSLGAVAGSMAKSREHQFQTQRDKDYQEFQKGQQVQQQQYEAGMTPEGQARMANEQKKREEEARLQTQVLKDADTHRHQLDDDADKVKRLRDQEEDHNTQVAGMYAARLGQAKASVPRKLSRYVVPTMAWWNNEREGAMVERANWRQMLQRAAMSSYDPSSKLFSAGMVQEQVQKVMSRVADDAGASLKASAPWEAVDPAGVAGRLQSYYLQGQGVSLETLQNAIMEEAESAGIPREATAKIVSGFFKDTMAGPAAGQAQPQPAGDQAPTMPQMGLSIPKADAAAFARWLGNAQPQLVGTYHQIAESRAGDPMTSQFMEDVGQLEATLDDSLEAYRGFSRLSEIADIQAQKLVRSGDLDLLLNLAQAGNPQAMLDFTVRKYREADARVKQFSGMIDRFDPRYLAATTAEFQDELEPAFFDLQRSIADLILDPTKESDVLAKQEAILAAIESKKQEVAQSYGPEFAPTAPNSAPTPQVPEMLARQEEDEEE